MEFDSRQQSQRVLLSDGTEILMEVNITDYDGPVGIRDIVISAKEAFSSVTSLANDLKSTVDSVKPDKATIEFSIELEKKGDDILSKIVNFSGKGGIKFTLEWNFPNKEKK